MGFRDNTYATFWDEPKRISDTLTTGRISISRKNKNTGLYEETFAGSVSFNGTAAASKALRLHNRDRIKLLSVDTESYKTQEPESKRLYRFKIWDFEIEQRDGQSAPAQTTTQSTVSNPSPDVLVEEDLPF